MDDDEDAAVAAPPVLAVNDYGLDRELAARANAKYDVAREQDARTWISMVLTRTDFSRGFGATLRDGTVLCDLVNAIRSGVVKRVYRGPQPFLLMENVTNFIQAARVMGVPETDLFTTVALFELKDLGQVVTCILALKRVAGSGWRAPAAPAGRFGPPVARAPGKLAPPKVQSRWRAGANPDAAVPRLAGGGFGFVRQTPQPIMSETNRATFAAKKPARRAAGSGSSLGAARRASVKAARAFIRRVSFGGKKVPQEDARGLVAHNDDDDDQEDDGEAVVPAPLAPQFDHARDSPRRVTPPPPDASEVATDWRHVPISSKPPPLVRRASIAAWLQGGASRAKASVRQLRGRFESTRGQQGARAQQPRPNKAPRATQHPLPEDSGYAALARFR